MTPKTTTKKQRTPFKGGSVHNYLMSNNSTLPVVGKGATRMSYSDRHCYEVIEVSPDGKTVKLEALDARWDQTKPGDPGHQNWILEPTGRFTTIVWRNNAWRTVYTEMVWEQEYYNNDVDCASKEEREKINAECWDAEKQELKLVAGKTRLRTTYPRINILFGVKNYYYDWEF